MRNTQETFKSSSFLLWYQSFRLKDYINLSIASLLNHGWQNSHHHRSYISSLCAHCCIRHQSCLFSSFIRLSMNDSFQHFFWWQRVSRLERTILIELSLKNKIGFIYKSCAAPDASKKGYQPWIRCDYMVTSWFLNSFSREITDSVIYSRSIKELWTTLENQFGQSNGSKLYHLLK